jgi:hypothetical protein
MFLHRLQSVATLIRMILMLTLPCLVWYVFILAMRIQNLQRTLVETVYSGTDYIFAVSFNEIQRIFYS